MNANDSELERVKAERDAAQRAAAEMRDMWKQIDALLSVADYETISAMADEALSGSSVSPYHHRDEYKPMVEAVYELMGQASEFIGPDEDNQPECVCCGMQLTDVSHGHRADCMANAVLNLSPIFSAMKQKGIIE